MKTIYLAQGDGPSRLRFAERLRRAAGGLLRWLGLPLFLLLLLGLGLLGGWAVRDWQFDGSGNVAGAECPVCQKPPAAVALLAAPDVPTPRPTPYHPPR